MKLALLIRDALNCIGEFIVKLSQRKARPCYKCRFYDKDYGYCCHSGLHVSVIKRSKLRRCYKELKKHTPCS